MEFPKDDFETTAFNRSIKDTYTVKFYKGDEVKRVRGIKNLEQAKKIASIVNGEIFQ